MRIRRSGKAEQRGMMPLAMRVMQMDRECLNRSVHLRVYMFALFVHQTKWVFLVGGGG